MSKFFLGLILVILGVGFFLLANSSLDKKNQESSPAAPGNKQAANTNLLDITLQGKIYRINWVMEQNPRNILLGANLDEKKTAKTLFDENQCQILTNAGFYTENNDYIGLLYVDGKKLSNESKDAFFNGVFSITKSGEVGIGSGVPLDQIKYAVQSGPVLVRYRGYQKLKSAEGEGGRRIVVAITNKKAVYFLAIFDPTSVYLGPKLNDLPEIIKKFADEKDLSFTDALNLDGGAHSALLTSGVSLDELSPIGSYLCAK